MDIKPGIFDNPEIFSEVFPDDVSVSDLCDCGRHKKRRLPGHNNKTKSPKHRGEFGVTDYTSTFKPKHARPRSSKRPPPSPRDPNPPPMTFDTYQRSEFTQPSKTGRPPAYKPEEFYEPPTNPFATETAYKKEYIPKIVFPEIVRPLSPKQDALRLSSAKFDPTTTSKTHFRRWTPQTSKPFAELPSFAGSILFPNKENLPESVTKETFIKRPSERAEAAKPSEDNLKIEGTMMFDTTHTKTYKQIHGNHRPPKVKPPTELSINLDKKSKFQSDTQFRRDFPGFKGQQPPPPLPAEPAKATINLKLSNKRRSFSTEQRAIYKGHDVKSLPVTKSCKKEEEEYKAPSIKFETETSQKRDFQPIDFKDAYPVPSIVPEVQLHTTNDAKFDDHTMSKEFFKKWPVQPRVKHGDFHENKAYIPPQVKFGGESESQEKFVPKVPEPITNYKPESKTIDKTGDMYLSTSYSQEFKGHKIKLCRAQVYLLQQQFKKWQAEQAAISDSQAVPVA